MRSSENHDTFWIAFLAGILVGKFADFPTAEPLIPVVFWLPAIFVGVIIHDAITNRAASDDDAATVSLRRRALNFANSMVHPALFIVVWSAYVLALAAIAGVL